MKPQKPTNESWSTYLLLTCHLLATDLLLTCYLLATYLLLTCYLLATYLLLTCYPFVTYLIPKPQKPTNEATETNQWVLIYLLATYLLLTCYLLVTYLLPTCCLLAAYLPPTCYLLATYLLLACYLLAQIWRQVWRGAFWKSCLARFSCQHFFFQWFCRQPPAKRPTGVSNVTNDGVCRFELQEIHLPKLQNLKISSRN